MINQSINQSISLPWRPCHSWERILWGNWSSFRECCPLFFWSSIHQDFGPDQTKLFPFKWLYFLLIIWYLCCWVHEFILYRGHSLCLKNWNNSARFIIFIQMGNLRFHVKDRKLWANERLWLWKERGGKEMTTLQDKSEEDRCMKWNFILKTNDLRHGDVYKNKISSINPQGGRSIQKWGISNLKDQLCQVIWTTQIPSKFSLVEP